MEDASERVLVCAEGYLQLGLLEDAQQELDSLPPEDRQCPEAIQLEVSILVRGKDWDAALSRSEDLIRRDPESHHGYLHTSFCLHELGRTLEARDRLLAVPVFVTEQPLYYYNLACYEAQLENPCEAENLLRKALKRDVSLCEVARSDPDLDPVREMVTTLVQRFEESTTSEEPWDSDGESED